MDGDQCYYDDERQYSYGRDSDDSPVLCNRYDKYRRLSPYTSPKVEREKRSTLTVLAKFFLFCTAMILFCVFMYIPVYNRANEQVTKGLVAGWSIDTNRDTKIYVQPNNITTILQPKNICTKNNKKNKLFLLVVVCSSTIDFERRVAIRNTWGSYQKYIELQKKFQDVKQRYKNYNFTYDLYSENVTNFNNVNVSRKIKRHISSFSQLLPELAKALQKNLVTAKTDDEVPEKRFEDDADKEMLPEFDMNEEMNEQTDPETSYDYYDSNVMRIPPKGYEDNPNLEKILNLLKEDKNFRKMKDSSTNNPPFNFSDPNFVPDFKVVFLLGLPTHDNDSTIQIKIEKETEEYGDVIQEGFIDSYNNLTLKSIMMLKWIKNNCNEKVRYILKTDDDMYINVPNLIDNLKNRSEQFDSNKKDDEKEYLLIGDLICGARPVADLNNKWYSPKYMYRGRVYPKYLSGTGYALSADTANALYAAALRTNYFHLEDIFITGMCSTRAQPRIVPRDDPLFSYLSRPGESSVCGAHSMATTHRVSSEDMYRLVKALTKPALLDTCERKRLTKVRQDRLKAKSPPKRTKHHS